MEGFDREDRVGEDLCLFELGVVEEHLGGVGLRSLRVARLEVGGEIVERQADLARELVSEASDDGAGRGLRSSDVVVQ